MVGDDTHNPRTGRRTFLAPSVAALVLVASSAGYLVGRSTDSEAKAAPTAQVAPAAVRASVAAPPRTATAIAAAAVPGVVSITSTVSGTTSSGVAGGTGFVLDRTGRILTNEHVVADASAVHVSFADGTKANAKVLAEDKLLDLAVIKVSVPSSVLKPLPLGSSDSLRLGDSVMAIGNPFGLDRSVSVGVVSGVHRQIQAPNGFTLSNAVQTDAAINHGNSGGPLLDFAGRVVGVNAQIADSGVNANVGVGFAIAIDTVVKRAIASMTQGKAVQHPWVGVSLDEVDAILGTSGRVKASSGVLLTGIVPGGPAAKAGLRGGSSIAQVDGAQYCVGGDIVTAVGGVKVTTSGELQTAVSTFGPGATVKFAIVRANGQKTSVPVTLGTQPATPPNTTTGCN